MCFRPFARLALSAVLLGTVALACSGKSSDDGEAGGAACPVATGCPDAGAPSYANAIQPIFQQACLPCHSPGGTAGFDESSYAKIFAQRSPILDQVNGCLMPPVNGPVMTSEQRVAMTAWLECGAPDN